MRSTSSARSSTRACRSASRSPSTRSSRRITWFMRPAHLGELPRDGQRLGCARPPARARRPSPAGSTRARPRRLRERLDLLARALERGVDAGRGRRGLPAACREALPGPLDRELGPRARKANVSPSDDAGFRARLRAAARADRPAPGGAARRVPAARLRPRDGRGRASRASRELRGGAARRTLVVVNDTRVVPARIPLERPSGEVLLLERVGRRRSGRGWRGRRGGCGPGGATAPVELVEHLGEGRWLLAARGRARTARRRCRRTSPSRSATRALPDGLRARRRLGGRADGRPALHARAARAARRRARDAPRRARHVPSGRRRTTLEEHELHGERYEVAPAAWERIERGRARARRRHDDGARARDAGARAAPLAGRTEPVRHARASSSGGSTRS